MKKIIALMLTFIMMLMVSGCGTNPQPVSEPEVVTVTVAVRNGEKSSWEAAVDTFRQQNPEINLKFIELGVEFEQYRLLTSALSSGESVFDVMEIEDVWLEEFVERGYVLPITCQTGDDYIGFAQDAFYKENTLYGVPFQMDIGMILAAKYYNWDGSLDSLRSEHSSDKNIAADSAEKNDVISTLMELVEYTGHDVRSALLMYRDIYGHETKGVKALNMFSAGDLPIIRAWSSVLPKFRGEKHTISGDFSVYNMPNGKSSREASVAKIFAMSVSTLSENKDAAMKFVEYCNSYEFQLRWAEITGTYPVYKSIYDEPSIKSEWNHITPMKDRIELVQIRPRMVSYTEQTDALQEDIELFLAGQLDMEAVAVQLEEFLQING